MSEETKPEGLLQAVSRRVRKLDHQARTDPETFWARQCSLPYDETEVAFLVRSAGTFILILTSYASLLGDAEHEEARHRC